MKDHLQPIQLTGGEAQKYINNYGCALCGGHLIEKRDGIHCIQCGPAFYHSTTKLTTLEIVANNRIAAMQDLNSVNSEPPRPPEEVLKDLGF